MAMEPPVDVGGRRPPPVGRQIRRWRAERGLTLARVAESAGLNVGYLSQIENDKASPSLACLSALAGALDVPIAWFLVEEARPPEVMRAADRRWREVDGGRASRVDGARLERHLDRRDHRRSRASRPASTPTPATSITS